MSGETLDWTLAIIDNITAPADAATEALGGLGVALKMVDDATNTSAKGLDEEASAAEKNASGIRHTGEEHEKAGEIFGMSNEKILTMAIGFASVEQAVEKGVEAVIEFAHQLFELGVELVKNAFEVGEFNRAMMLSLTAITGSSEAAGDMSESLHKIATSAGVASDPILKMGRDLLAVGFSAEQTKDIIAGGLDVGQVLKGGGEEGKAAMEATLRLVERIHETGGKLTTRELVGFGQQSNINPDEIIKTIANAKGISEEIAKQMAMGGEIGADEMTSYILDTIKRTVDAGGELGSGATKAALQSVPAQIQAIKNNFNEMFEGTSGSGIATLLASVADTFKPGSPAAEGVKNIVDMVVKTLGPAVAQLGVEFGKAFGGANSEKTIEQLALLTHYVIFLFQGVFDLITVWMKLDEMFTKIETTLEGLAARMRVFGGEIVHGLILGIQGGFGELTKTWNDLIGHLPAIVSDKLQIHSPSKVFEQLGSYTTEGFIVGMAANDIHGTMQHMVTPPTATAIPSAAIAPTQPSSTMAQGAGGNQSTTHNKTANVNIHAPGASESSAKAIAAEVKRILISELGIAAEGLSVEAAA